MLATPQLKAAMQYLAQKVSRAETCRALQASQPAEPHRKSAEHAALMLIGAAQEAVDAWTLATAPSTADLLRVTEVPLRVVLPGTVGRLFIVTYDDLSMAYVRASERGALVHCVTHASGECDCVARVHGSGLLTLRHDLPAKVSA